MGEKCEWLRERDLVRKSENLRKRKREREREKERWRERYCE